MPIKRRNFEFIVQGVHEMLTGGWNSFSPLFSRNTLKKYLVSSITAIDVQFDDSVNKLHQTCERC